MTRTCIRWNQTSDATLRRLTKINWTAVQISKHTKTDVRRVESRITYLGLSQNPAFDMTDYVERICLKCREPFPSEWIGNRLCGRCVT